MSRVKKLIIAAVFVSIFSPITLVCAMNDGSVPEEETKENAAAVSVMSPKEIAEHNRLVEYIRPRVIYVGYFLPSSLVEMVAEYAMPTQDEVQKANNNLLDAANRGDLEAVTRALVDAVASINAVDVYGDTPLNNLHFCFDASDTSDNRMCTKMRCVAIARMFLENKADVNVASKGGWTSLHSAVENGSSVAMVRLLLNAGASIEAVDKRGETALHKAVSKGNSCLAKELLWRGANPDAANYWITPGHYDSWTPLCWAVKKGYFDLVRMLVLAGADFDRASAGDTFDNQSPFSLARQHGQTEETDLQKTMREMQQVKRTLDGCDALPRALNGQLILSLGQLPSPLIDILYDYALPCDQSDEVRAEIQRRKDIRLQKQIHRQRLSRCLAELLAKAGKNK